MICTAKPNAHPIMNLSPYAIERSSPYIDIRYRPAMPIATAIHVLRWTAFPSAIERTGTITVYNAVIKPVFPMLVYITPYCCKDDAMKRMTPQHTPPMNTVLFQPISTSEAFAADRSRSLSRTYITGSRKVPPIRNRIPLNVNVPICPPSFCARKAVPQMNAASNISRLLFNCLLIIKII